MGKHYLTFKLDADETIESLIEKIEAITVAHVTGYGYEVDNPNIITLVLEDGELAYTHDICSDCGYALEDCACWDDDTGPIEGADFWDEYAQDKEDECEESDNCE